MEFLVCLLVRLFIQNQIIHCIAQGFQLFYFLWRRILRSHCRNPRFNHNTKFQQITYQPFFIFNQCKSQRVIGYAMLIRNKNADTTLDFQYISGRQAL